MVRENACGRFSLASHGLGAESSSGDELMALIFAERARIAPLIRRIGLAQ